MTRAVIDLGRERRLRAIDERMRDALQGRPGLAVRVARWSQTPSYDTRGGDASKMKVTDVRMTLSLGLLERASRLVDAMKEDDKVIAHGRVSRASVLRVAIAEGIEVLEARYQTPPQTPEKAPRRDATEDKG